MGAGWLGTDACAAWGEKENVIMKKNNPASLTLLTASQSFHQICENVSELSGSTHRRRGREGSLMLKVKVKVKALTGGGGGGIFDVEGRQEELR